MASHGYDFVIAGGGSAGGGGTGFTASCFSARRTEAESLLASITSASTGTPQLSGGVLLRVHHDYAPKKLYVTESGAASAFTTVQGAFNWLVDNYPDAYLSMGLTAERVGQRFGITREQSDEFSLGSHQKALAAIQAGKFADETVAVPVSFTTPNGKKPVRHEIAFKVDEGPRADTDEPHAERRARSDGCRPRRPGSAGL